MAQMMEMRELTRDRVLRAQEEQELSFSKERYAVPQVGDLVLLRRFVVDKDRGRKLEARWEGPYLLQKIAKPGISGYLRDIKTGKIRGRYGFNAMKVYVLREHRTVTEGVELGVALTDICADWYKGRRTVDVENWVS